MRTIIYAIVNKETNKRVYVNAREIECRKVLAEMDNKEQFEIRYKWMSI